MSQTADPGPKDGSRPKPESMRNLAAKTRPNGDAAASAAGYIINGDFEWGPDGSWEEYSSHNYGLIFNFTESPDTPYAHSGDYAAWLGGLDYEDSQLSQMVTIPAEDTSLYFWVFYFSIDACEYDYASVLVDGMQVWSETTCSKNRTSDWFRRKVDLSAYAGQTVTLTFRSTTDSDWRSSFFLDDVSIGPSQEDPLSNVIYLPVSTSNYFPKSTYSEDFSVNNGRWVSVNSSYIDAGYLNGEYQVRLNQPNGAQLITPDLILSSNYRVEVDAREVDYQNQGDYGLMVAIGWLNNYTTYEGIQFMVNPSAQGYYVSRRTGDNQWSYPVDFTYDTDVIRADKPNYLRVDRIGVAYKFYINSELVQTIYDAGFTSAGRDAGFRVYSYDAAPTDIRFDNFYTTPLP